MVYAHGPHTSFSARAGGLPGVGALAMGGVAFSDDPAEVQVAAGVSMHVPGAWEALASGVLPGALFPLPEGETALPVRVGWQVSGTAPNVRLMQGHVHVTGHDAFLVQVLGDGERKTGGSILASTSGEDFADGDTITLGVPWLSEHGELLLAFGVEHLRAAAQAVREAAVTEWLTLPVGLPAYMTGGETMASRIRIFLTVDVVRRIIASMQCDKFTTVDFIRIIDGGTFLSDRGTPPSRSRNARIGKFLSDHEAELGIVLLERKIPTTDDNGRRTSTARWRKRR